MSLSCPDYPVHHLKAMQVLTLNVHYENLLSFQIITIMDATMISVEKLRGEAELDSDANDMNPFCFQW